MTTAPVSPPRGPTGALTDLLRTEHPIVLSPMAGLGTVELAAAVCAAGGLGSLGCAGMAPDAVARAVTRLRGLTSAPINVNFFCHPPPRADAVAQQAWAARLAPYYRECGLDPPPPTSGFGPFDDAVCAVVEELAPEVVSFHFGLPAPHLLDRVRAAGCRVLSSATTVAEARWLQDHGVDAVIAQGSEAGGHRATFLPAPDTAGAASQPGTIALVPQVVDAVDVPVIAAGGIGDGRGIAAAFALGAAGVQIGTAYLRCPEAATPPLYRQALARARADTTVVTDVFTGRPARALVNRLTREVGPITEAPAFPLPMGALAPLRAAAEEHGGTDFTGLWAGQAAALTREMPAEALTHHLITTSGLTTARGAP